MRDTNSIQAVATFTKRQGKNGVRWRALVRRKGVVACNTFPTKLQAQEWAAGVERDAMAGEYRQRGRVSLAQVLLRWQEECGSHRKGSRWELLRLRAFAEREKRLCALPLSSVDVGALEQWRDTRLASVSPSTVRREIALLGAVFSQAVRWGLIRANPLKDVKKPAAPAARRRGVSVAEIEAITLALGDAGAGGQIAAAFLLSIETGMRCGEILGLTWDHVNLAERYVTLPKTKNGDSRQVPLSTAAANLLKELWRSRVPLAKAEPVFTVTGPTLDVLFRRARDSAVKDCPSCATVRFHDARSEAITRLSRKLDVLELARVVGHRNLSSLLFYYSKSASDIAKKLD